jgi:hypothetical protein
LRGLPLSSFLLLDSYRTIDSLCSARLRRLYPIVVVVIADLYNIDPLGGSFREDDLLLVFLFGCM